MERPPDPHDLLKHAGFLRALALGLLRDEHLAEDVVQDSLAAALVAGERRKWRSWLGAVARNIASKVRRGERRREARGRRGARPESLPSAADLAAQLELQRRVVAAVSELDEPHRSTVVFRYLHGLDAAEIARREGVPPATVRARVSRALAILRARLDREHGGRAGWSALLLPLLPNESAAGAALGGIVMAANKKIAVVVALVLALGSAALLWRTAVAPDRAPSRAGRSSTAAWEGSGEPAVGEKAAVTVTGDDAGPRVDGIALDPEGRPVAGARVLVYPEASTSAVFVDDEEARVRTDAAGRFAAPLPGPARGWTLHVAADGFAPAILEPVEPGEEVEVRLEALATLRGHVRNMDGEPVGGALVRWLGVFGGAAMVRETRSADDGSYAMAVPPPKGAFSALSGTGGALVEVRATGYAPLLVEADFWQAVIPERLEMDLVVVRGAIVRGRVLDYETKEPVAGARVVLWSDEGRASIGRYRSMIQGPFVPRALDETVADRDGAFAFDHVPAHGFHPLAVQFSSGRSACVGAVADGYVRGGAQIPAPVDGAKVETDILLARAAYVRGRVVDAAGVPVAGTSVHASGRWATVAWPPLYGEPLHEAPTDAEGRYPTRVVGGLRDGSGTARIMAVGGSIDVRVRAGETVEAPDLVLEARTEPTSGVDVLVVDRSGAPVRDAHVWSADEGIAVSTDENGRAILPSIRTTLTVAAEARGFAPGVSQPVELRQNIVAIRIVLGEAQRLRGRVVWEDGAPAEGALVVVLNGEAPLLKAMGDRLARYAMTEAGADGWFTARDLPGGPYHVHATFHRAPGPVKPEAHVSSVPTGASDVVVTLAGRYDVPGALEGTVVDASTGKGPLGLRVKVGEYYARVYAPGRFRAEHLAAGVHAVLVEAPGYAARDASVEVGDGVATLHIELERGGTVFGRVTDETGGAVRSEWVTLAPEGPALWRIPSAQIAKDGSYRLDVVGPGIYHPVVSGSLLAVKAYQPIVVRTGGVHEANFTVARGGELRIRVGFATRQSQEDLATLRVLLEGEGLVRAWAKATFASAALPPGRYTVRLHYRDRVVQESTAEVKAGEGTEVRLDVP